MAFVYNVARESHEWLKLPGSSSAGPIPQEVDVFDWQHNSTKTRYRIDSVAALRLHPTPALRILCSPLDIRVPDRTAWLQGLFEYCDMPAEFILERQHSVTHSFGDYENEVEHVCWSHFLCKNVVLKHEAGRPSVHGLWRATMSQDDDSWLRSGYFLRWKKQELRQSQRAEVLLIVFGASKGMQVALNNVYDQQHWQDVLRDPLCLFSIVLNDIFEQISGTMYNLLKVVRYEERAVLASAESATEKHDFDFVGMHNMYKHIIHLKEGSSAAYSTATRLCNRHAEFLKRPEPSDGLEVMRTVHGLLLHKQTLLEGCVMRINSIESRLQNMTNLAFNTVSQRDSRVILADGRAMKSIASLTMLFLPVTAVATVFGSNFFDYDPRSQTLVTASNFGWFWAITMPMTLLIMLAYSTWYLKSAERLRGLIEESYAKIRTRTSDVFHVR